ncbi:MAG: hypothetical protein U0169_02835 [Polyangiaceae bacterium]
MAPSEPDRPAFLATFPADPELDRLVAAFVDGRYDVVRKDAPLLAAKTEDESVKKAALELRERIEPAPMVRALLGLTLLLLILLSAYWIAKRGGPH